ncbi:EamA family transporter [Salinibacterium sp. dk2585]|uniref:EamA family transporter n=1 Tax=unclassified Salinibacterium TaxID=2632331 RepID=UPI0011C24F03|nr:MULTISPECIES: EamA family transporter [unclassified Salinibacterium]QEE60672.1 EamA family transporter [Salinibacterium sp. dk2585]TXK55744.1 EamA family transporter [Salinibacterium sp. dk5596]
MKPRDRLLAALVALIWGLNFVVIDWGMEGVPPLLFVAIRFVVVLLPAIFFVRRPQVPWRFIVGVGLFMSLGQFALLYSSMHLGMPPGLAALVLQAQVVFTMLIAAGALREIPRPTQLAGALIGSLGLAVVAFGRDAQVPLLAFLLCIGAALSWGVGNVVSRASGAKGGLSLTVWSALVVPVPLFVLSLLLEGPQEVATALSGLGIEAILATLYTAVIASLVAYGIFNSLLSRYPAASVVPWILLVPVVGIVAAWLLLGEVPNTAELLGGALMLAGLLVAQRAGAGPFRRVRS